MTSVSKAHGVPVKYGIQPVPHRKFNDMFACRIYVPFEGMFWLVDRNNSIDVFSSRDEAMAAGARALLPILNRKIPVFRAGVLAQPEDVARGIAKHGKKEIEFHFFAGELSR